MASPQTHHGYTRVANELLRAIYRFPFSGQELRLVLWVMRNVYGWKGRRETQPASIREMAADLFMPVATVGWVTKGLRKRGILVRTEDGGWKFNKNYDEWLERGVGQLDLSAAAFTKAPSRRTRKAKSEPDPATRKTPALEDVQAYCLARKSVVDPAKFWNHYEANGWVSGKSHAPVTNWKSMVCYWERSNYKALTPTGKLCPLCEVNQLPYPNAIVCEKCGARCRLCHEQTAKLKIITRRDGTKTAQCRNGCNGTATALTAAAIPAATKSSDAAAAAARFEAEHNRRKAGR